MQTATESISEGVAQPILERLPVSLRSELLKLIAALCEIEGQERFWLHEVWIFGSHARDQAHWDSDIDLLVLIDDGCLAKNPALFARRAIARSSACLPYDLLVLQRSDWEREKYNRWTCYPQIKGDRKLLYAR